MSVSSRCFLIQHFPSRRWREVFSRRGVMWPSILGLCTRGVNSAMPTIGRVPGLSTRLGLLFVYIRTAPCIALDHVRRHGRRRVVPSRVAAPADGSLTCFPSFVIVLVVWRRCDDCCDGRTVFQRFNGTFCRVSWIVAWMVADVTNTDC